jgi:hypothetical protein
MLQCEAAWGGNNINLKFEPELAAMMELATLPELAQTIKMVPTVYPSMKSAVINPYAKKTKVTTWYNHWA